MSPLLVEAKLAHAGQLTSESGPIQEEHLISPAHGWVLAENRLLWTDSNGGQWTDVTPPQKSTQRIEGVFFLNESLAGESGAR